MTPDQDLSARLLPCPFCGGEAKLHCEITDERTGYAQSCSVRCSACGASRGFMDAQNPKGGYALAGTGKAKSIAAWNRRAPADHERAVQAAVAKAVEAEREACAAIIDSNMLCEARDGSEVLHPRTNPGNKTGVAYAAAIRSRGVAG